MRSAARSHDVGKELIELTSRMDSHVIDVKVVGIVPLEFLLMAQERQGPNSLGFGKALSYDNSHLFSTVIARTWRIVQCRRLQCSMLICAILNIYSRVYFL